MVTLTSISPVSGPPGTLVTCTGAGFDAGSRVGCPALVATTFLSSTQVTATIPQHLGGPQGGSTQIAVFVFGSDGSVSVSVPFTVIFPRTKLQVWTGLDAVVGEVPGFQRGGKISDDQIQTWMRSVAQEVSAEMLRRGLSLDSSTWPQPSTAADPTPTELLEMLNRMGAGARLAAAIGTQFASGGGEWGVSKNLSAAYARQLGMLRAGDYDHLFTVKAATVESGPLLSASHEHEPMFTKNKVF